MKCHSLSNYTTPQWWAHWQIMSFSISFAYLWCFVVYHTTAFWMHKWRIQWREVFCTEYRHWHWHLYCTIPALVLYNTGTCTVQYRHLYCTIPALVLYNTGTCTVQYRHLYCTIPAHVLYNTGTCTVQYRHLYSTINKVSKYDSLYQMTI
jgi:hypothetical protein